MNIPKLYQIYDTEQAKPRETKNLLIHGDTLTIMKASGAIKGGTDIYGWYKDRCALEFASGLF
jgi:hypothetical protein